MTFNILKDVAKRCGQLDWNTKLSELDEQAILYLVMTIQQMKDYLNDASIMIKRVSREVFMDADIGTRRHKDKKKYNRKVKHKKGFTDDM